MSDIAWFICNFVAELFSPRLGNRAGAGMLFDIMLCLIATSSLLAYRRLLNALAARRLAPVIGFLSRRGNPGGSVAGAGPGVGGSDRAR